jgi:hypothetical protein
VNRLRGASGNGYQDRNFAALAVAAPENIMTWGTARETTEISMRKDVNPWFWT